MTGGGLVVLYLVFCLLTGLCGTQRRLGFFGTFLVSLALTPVVVLLYLLFTVPAKSAQP
ncbi:MAG: hypothetical protein QOH32_1296 [Bradyrhizobium sp.]|jgi:hypothetical protein|nr:hypothetical protein [Bradyrhizobium sp.]